MADRRFVLLDRDGTINFDRHYLSDPAEVELIPGAAAGLIGLTQAGCGLAVMTNQSGVARGLISPAAMRAVNDRLVELLAAAGVKLDGIYVCPHIEADDCRCRKPRPGLVEQAARELGFDPREAFMIGDKRCDVELGQNVGATTLLVRSGYGAQTEREGRTTPDYVVDDLSAAAQVIEGLLRIRKPLEEG